jgi:hypothetical protein
MYNILQNLSGFKICSIFTLNYLKPAMFQAEIIYFVRVYTAHHNVPYLKFMVGGLSFTGSIDTEAKFMNIQFC